MATKVLRDRKGKTLGRIRERSGGFLDIFDASGKRLGYYDPKQDRTVDAKGKVVGKGNLLTMLLD